MLALSCFILLISISIISIVNGDDSLLFTQDTLEDSHGRIIYSSVIFRHGERSPIIQYPTDPYAHESYWKAYWPQGIGQLSKKGKLQEYNLGKWFRKRYDFLIKNGYRYDLLQMHSSDIDRTIMSAECFLAGFFPPSPKEMWTDDGLKWQPVPVRAIPMEVDVMIASGFECNIYDLEKDILNRSPEMRNFYLKHKKIFEYIAAHSGLEMSPNKVLDSIDNAFYLYDTLFVEESSNLKLPAWTKSIYPEPLRTIGAPSLTNFAYSRQMKRIKAGTLIGKVVEEMELKILEKLDANFHFYSGHDSTISGLLTTLGIFNGLMPPYSTSVIFELRQKDKEYVVTILYRNSTTSAPYHLQLPGCGNVCKLKDFKKLTENLIPENWQVECGNNHRKEKNAQNEDGIKWPNGDLDFFSSESYENET